MSKISIDLDDTLYSFRDLAYKLMTAEAFRTGDEQLQIAAYSQWPEWRTPADLLGIDRWMEVISWCHDSDAILSQRSYDGAVETVTALAEEGHDLLYISNRATETEDATKQWLMIRRTFKKPSQPRLYFR